MLWVGLADCIGQRQLDRSYVRFYGVQMTFHLQVVLCVRRVCGKHVIHSDEVDVGAGGAEVKNGKCLLRVLILRVGSFPHRVAGGHHCGDGTKHEGGWRQVVAAKHCLQASNVGECEVRWDLHLNYE